MELTYWQRENTRDGPRTRSLAPDRSNSNSIGRSARIQAAKSFFPPRPNVAIVSFVTNVNMRYNRGVRNGGKRGRSSKALWGKDLRSINVNVTPQAASVGGRRPSARSTRPHLLYLPGLRL